MPYKQGRRGCSSMVEQKLPKLTTRVRFPSPAPKIFMKNKLLHAVLGIGRKFQ
jgi:hypothetical protein